MPGKVQKAVDSWRDADAAARAAEAQLKAAWDEHALGEAAPPSAEMLEEVSRLRSIANHKLTTAMMLMRDRGKGAP